MEDNMKFVEFNKYCPTCKHYDTLEVKDPCNDCLAVGAREGSEIPEKYDKKV